MTKFTTSTLLQKICLSLIAVIFCLPAIGQDGVWPGDADNNGIVNVVDQLHIGYARGATGPERAIMGIEFQNAGVPNADWVQQFPDGTNYFYADADGNGIVDDIDFTAVDANYGLTHGVVQGSGYQTSIPDVGSLLALEINDPLAILENQLIVDVVLGQLDLPVNDFYGIAFKLKLAGLNNLPITNVNFVEADNSWIGNDSVFSYARQDAASDEVDVAVTRVDGLAVDGGGTIGSIVIIIDDVVLSPTLDTIQVAVDSVRMVGKDFVDLPVITSATDLILGQSECNAVFGFIPTACPTLQFTDRSLDNTNRPIARWQWDFGDGKTSSLPSPIHAYADNGVYTSCLTITTLDGCASTYCEDIMVECVLNACDLQTTVEQLSCDSYQFKVENPDPSQNYHWFVNEEETGVQDSIYQFQTDSAGIFTICGAYEDLTCPEGVRYCHTVTVTDSCFIDCSFSIDIDTLNCSQFLFSESDNKVLGWSINNQAITMDTAFSFNAAVAGTYEICGHLQNDDCPDGATICNTITVADSCFYECDFEVVIDTVNCDNYRLISTIDRPLIWSVDNDSMTTSTVFNFNPTAGGTYEVCGFLQDELCPEGTRICNPITVPDSCFFDCEFDVLIDTISCDNYRFVSTIDRPLVWSVDNDSITTSNVFNFNPTTGGTFEVCGFLQDDLCTEGARICNPITVADSCFFDCDFEVVIDTVNCDSYRLISTIDRPLIWSVDNDSMTTSTVFNFNPTTGGTFEVCGFLQDDLCPEGARICNPINVADSCFFDCDFEVVIDTVNCDSYRLISTIDRPLIWSVDNDSMTTSTVFNFNPTAGGTYEVCGFLQDDLCPEGARICNPITVADNCFFDCDFEVVIDTVNCDNYRLISTIDRPLVWSVDNDSMTTSTVFNFNPTTGGTFEVCGFLQDDLCPEGAMICNPIIVADSCFFDCDFSINMDNLSCDEFRFSESDNKILTWSVDSQVVEMSNVFNFIPTEAGTYEICGLLQNNDCTSSATLCEILTIDESCFVDPCLFTLMIDTLECNSYNFSSIENKTLFWFVDGNVITSDNTFNFSAGSNGMYEICAYLENGDCTEGATICETIIVPEGCLVDPCSFSISMDSIACDDYLFAASEGTILSWSVDDELIAIDSTFNFSTTEVGTYEICGTLENSSCSNEVTICDTILIEESCLIDAVTSTALTESAILYLAPNPTKGDLIIQLKTTLAIDYQVFDISGRRVLMEQRAVAESHLLDTQELAAGVYFIRMVADGKVESAYFIKQ